MSGLGTKSFTRTRSSPAMTARPGSAQTRPRTSGGSASRGVVTPRITNSARSQSSKGERIHIKQNIGEYSFEGLVTHKSPPMGPEQKQTVSVYKRIESKPMDNLEKVISNYFSRQFLVPIAALVSQMSVSQVFLFLQLSGSLLQSFLEHTKAH